MLSSSKYERGVGEVGSYRMAFYVYILECSDDSYYTGHTDDLEKRLETHNSGELDGYTKNRRPLKLVFLQECSSRDEAFATERQIKGWTRRKKEAIIRDRWDLLPNLARAYMKKDEELSVRGRSC